MLIYLFYFILFTSYLLKFKVATGCINFVLIFFSYFYVKKFLAGMTTIRERK